MRTSDGVALVAVLSLVSLIFALTSGREPKLSSRKAPRGIVQGGSMRPSVGGVWIGDEAARVVECWGKPSEIQADTCPVEPDGSPSPYVVWLYPKNEWVRFHQKRVQSLFTIKHRLRDAGAILAGPGSTFKEVLGFWGPPLPDEYSTGNFVSYQIAGQGASLSFEHDGSQCTGLIVVGDASVPGSLVGQ